MNKLTKIYIIAIVLLALDQLSKFLSLNYLSSSIEIIPDFFYLTLVKNEGAIFGIMQNSNYLFIALSFLIFILFTFHLIKKREFNTLELISFPMLLGGILGNLIDRVIHGFVIDFLDFRFFNYHFPVFNLADTFIVISIIIIIIREIKDEIR